MPIYAYRCATCGHAQDALQKMSDPVLTVCPACGASTYVKQVTAAGFQLKGSGWYVTDFREGAKAAKPADSASAEGDKGDKKAAANGEGAAAPAESGKKADAPAAAPAPPGASPSPAPAAAKEAPVPAPKPAPSGKLGG